MGRPGLRAMPQRLPRNSTLYPEALARFLGDSAPLWIDVLGEPSILNLPSLALFCSLACPGRLILRTYDLALALREAGVAVISGFHSPVEKEALPLLLRGKQPVIICPARSIAGRPVPAEWRRPLGEGRLVVLSPFDEKQRRPTAELAWRRNAFAAALADQTLIVHASTESRMLAFAREIAGWRKPLLCLEGDENAALMEVGATPVSAEWPGWVPDAVSAPAAACASRR